MNVHIERAALLIALLLASSGTVAQEDAAERALPAAMERLRDENVNVRRAAAIICYRIIEKADLPDRDLLDVFLQRMVDETDLKCRSNLSRVVRLLVEDVVEAAKPKPVQKPALPRKVVELGKAARFDIQGHKGVLFAELRATEVISPGKVRCSVRLVRKDGTDAGERLDWPGVAIVKKRVRLTFMKVQIEPDVPASFAGVGVEFTAAIVDEKRVAFEVKTAVYT